MSSAMITREDRKAAQPINVVAGLLGYVAMRRNQD